MNTRTFAMIFGVAFLVIGLGGFVMAPTTPGPHPDLDMTSGFGHSLGLFPINTLHNIVHIAFGLWGLAASRSLGGSVTYFRGVAIAYALLTVMGLVEAGKVHTTFGFIPLYGNDIWLHALLALVAAYFGWMHRDRGAADRG
jgi:hypothetical protein